MDIGLNGQKILVKQKAGVEKYIWNVFNSLAKIDKGSDKNDKSKGNKYIIYLTEEPTKEEWEELTNNNPNFKYKVILPSKIPFISWTQMKLAWELFRNPMDVVFYPTDTLSGLLNILKPFKFKAVCMIHDLGYKVAKEYKNPIKRIIHFFTIGWVVCFSKKIIVPSRSTKEKIEREYSFFKFGLFNKASEDKVKETKDKIKDEIKDKIIVIPEGVDKSFYKRSKEEIDKIKEKYNLKNTQYIHFISTIQPRKNLERTIEAFSLVIKENSEFKDMKFVISGKKGWDYEEALNLPKKLNIENSIVFLGRTPDEDLPSLLSGAVAYISASLEEGFGLPLVEAMLCEIPVIASDIPPYKEIGKEYLVYVDPKDIQSIKEGILTILRNKYSLDNIKKAKEEASKYTWEECARKTLDVLEKANQK